MTRAGAWAASGLASGLALLGCGRSPTLLPCDGFDPDPEIPAVTCSVPAFCGANRFQAQISPANALVVLDRSCSMATVLEGRSKWSRAVEAVVGAVSDPRADSIRWGLSLFPTGDTEQMDGPVLVPLGEGQDQVVVSLLNQALERDDPNHPHQAGEACFTNLSAATSQVVNQGVFEDLDGRSHVILITDGFAGEGLTAANDLERLRDREVPTFVVGFGEQVNVDMLERLGEAGGVPPGDEVAYYRAGLDDLGQALLRVVEGLRCWYTLDMELEDLERAVVHFDGGQRVPHDPTGVDGWRYEPSATSLVFSGPSCDRLLAGEVQAVELELNCE